MTTNKPEVVGLEVKAHSSSPLIRLSDYEALQSECEQMRKDIERYRWLREQHWSTGEMAVLANPKQDAKLGAWLPSGDLLEQAIDAAIKGEEE